jgi:hypothetical protein
VNFVYKGVFLFMANIVKKAKNKDNPYAQIDKAMLNNPEISLKAKGLLSLLLSKPDDWETIIENLVNSSLDGWDSVKSGIRELDNYGYVIRKRVRNEFGEIIGSETIVYDEPQHPPKKPVKRKKYKTKPKEDNPSEVELQGFKLKEDNPSEENPLEENRTLLKQIITNKDNTNQSDQMEFDSIDSMIQFYADKYKLPYARILSVYDRVIPQYKAGNVQKFTPYFEKALGQEKVDYEHSKFIGQEDAL